MIMNKHPDILEYLGLKKKDLSTNIHMCFNCWLIMPETLSKHTSSDHQEKISDGSIDEVCSKCGNDLHIADYGNWIFSKDIDYYHTKENNEQ